MRAFLIAIVHGWRDPGTIKLTAEAEGMPVMVAVIGVALAY
jgi:hypothetical protein